MGVGAIAIRGSAGKGCNGICRWCVYLVRLKEGKLPGSALDFGVKMAGTASDQSARRIRQLAGVYKRGTGASSHRAAAASENQRSLRSGDASI